MVSGFSVSTPAISAAKPMVTARAASVHHSGERVVKSLMRSTASRVIGSLPGRREVGGGGDRGGGAPDGRVVLDGFAGELDERLLERATLRAQLVQDDPLGGGQLTDRGAVHPGHDQALALVADGGALLAQCRAEQRDLRAAHQDRVLG